MNTSSAGQEKRTSPRVTQDLIKNCDPRQTLDAFLTIGGNSIGTEILDLGGKGIAVMTKFYIPICTSPALSFSLIYRDERCCSKFQKVRALCELSNKSIIKNKGYRIGFQFTEMSSADLSAISEFIRIASSKNPGS